MAEKNSKFVALVAVLIFAAVGLVVMLYLNETISKMSGSGIIANILDLITTPGLLEGLLWLVLCVIVYIGVSKLVQHSEKIGPISLWFLILWIGAVLGLFVGNVIWFLIKGTAVTIDPNTLIQLLFNYLPYSLGPALAAALAFSNK